MRPSLPTQPIPGEPALASAVPFGVGHPGPWLADALVRAAITHRRHLAHARGVLTRGVHHGNALGVRGLALTGAAGWQLTAARVRAVADHTDAVLHPSRVTDLRHLRTASPQERRRIGRVGHPLLHRHGGRGFDRISWDEAEALATEALSVPGDRQGWLVGDVVNEAALALSTAAGRLGAPLDDLAGPLGRGIRAGLSEALGTGHGTCRLSDVARTSLLLLWRTALPDHAPEALSLIRDARAAGARVVVIDAVRDPGMELGWLGTPTSALFGTTLVDDTLLVPAGSEALVASALLALLTRWNAVDEHTAARQFLDWPERAAELRAWRGDVPLRRAGVNVARVEWLAKLLAAAPTALSVVGEGLWAARGGSEALAGISQLHVALGPLRRPGCGVLPVWSSAADQGCHDLGIGADEPEHRLLARLAAAERGEVDTLVLAEADLRATLPHPARVDGALRRVQHRIHHGSHLDATTLCPPAPGGWVLLLPATSRFDEAGGTTTTTLDRRLCFNPELASRRQVGSSRPLHAALPSLVGIAHPEHAEALSWPTTAILRREMASQVPRYAEAAHLGPETPELPLGPSRHEVDPQPRPCRVVVEGPSSVPDRFQLVLRPGVPLGGEARLPATGRGIGRNEVGISHADAGALRIEEGQVVTVASEAGRWAGRARILDQAPGSLWVPWPEAAAVVPWSTDDDGGLVIDVDVSLSCR